MKVDVSLSELLKYVQD